MTFFEGSEGLFERLAFSQSPGSSLHATGCTSASPESPNPQGLTAKQAAPHCHEKSPQDGAKSHAQPDSTVLPITQVLLLLGKGKQKSLQ